MGPLPGGSGNEENIKPWRQMADELQWGRFPEEAEIALLFAEAARQCGLQWGRFPEEAEIHSLPAPRGPGERLELQWGRFPEEAEMAAWHGEDLIDGHGFNGAASRRKRKSHCSPGGVRASGMRLQWGRFPEEAEMRRDVPREGVDLMLQWGRFPEEAEMSSRPALHVTSGESASMGPLPGGSGNTRRWRALRSVWPQASMGPLPGGSGNVEVRLDLRLEREASMGPLPGGSGNGFDPSSSAVDQVASMGPLPGGSGNPSQRRDRRCRERGFNGAASRRKRKSSWPATR